MATTVEIGTIRGFVLDDPERGVLDNTTYGLGGLAFVDVSDKVASVSIARGKNRDLERYSAGTLGVTFNNEDRFFDPVVGTAVDLVPRVPIRVQMDGTAQFYGSVNDWNFAYSTDGSSKAEVQASDDFVYLARQAILASGSAVEQTTGERVAAVLDMFTVDWPADRRNIDTGDNTVCAAPFDGSNALEYLQKVEASEQGQLFMAKDGDLTFLSRSSSAARSTGLVTFADDGSGVPFTEAAVNYGSELLYNRAIVTAPVGSATADNALSQLTYGIVETELEVLCSSVAQLQDIADYIVARYAEPELRFETITVTLDTVTPAQRAQVLGLEIGDVAEIIFTPNQTGSAIDRYAQIININHSETPARHNVTFSFDSLDFAPLVLDDTVFGKLDEGKLGF